MIAALEPHARRAPAEHDRAAGSAALHVERPSLRVAGQRHPLGRLEVPALREPSALLVEHEVGAGGPRAARPLLRGCARRPQVPEPAHAVGQHGAGGLVPAVEHPRHPRAELGRQRLGVGRLRADSSRVPHEEGDGHQAHQQDQRREARETRHRGRLGHRPRRVNRRGRGASTPRPSQREGRGRCPPRTRATLYAPAHGPREAPAATRVSSAGRATPPRGGSC